MNYKLISARMISIIIPVYNRQKELNKCLASIMRQSSRDFEVLVVDDGSDEPIKIAAGGEGKIKLYRIEHGGAPRARNYGFQKSKGEYILFCDADMILEQNCLEKMSQVLDKEREVDFVYADFKYGWKKFKWWDFDIEKLRQNNYISTCSMLRREKVVDWDEKLKRLQDWDFWLTISERGGRGRYIPQVLFRASVMKGGMSAWLPKAAYKLGFLNRVRKYRQAKKIVADKHNLPD